MTLRIPEDLEAQLRTEALKEDRSVNSQVVHILREHFNLLPLVRPARAGGEVIGIAKETVQAGGMVELVVQSVGVWQLPPSPPTTEFDPTLSESANR